MREILWRDGKFVRRDGSTFVPYGGVFAEAIFADRCGITIRPECRRPWGASNLLRFDDANDDELLKWLRYLKAEGMNYMRYFCASARRMAGEPLDIGGKLNPSIWPKLLHYMDLAAQEGVYFHFVLFPEPRTTIYMQQRHLEENALQYYTPDEIAALPAHRRRFLDPAQPRVGYDTYFADADVLACHIDLLRAMAPDLVDHPALLCVELYNEQQWDNDQFQKGRCFLWEVHDQEVAWSAELVRAVHRELPGVPVCCSFAGLGLAAQDPLLWIDRIPMDFFSPHLYQGLAGVPLKLDFAGISDVALKYSQPELPTMIGEFDPSDFKEGVGNERLVVRDVAWFSVLNNCPGFGMWTSRGYAEFDIPRRVMESIDFAHFQPKAPAVMVNIAPQVEYFHSLEHGAGPDCLLPADYWCPHRPEDHDHIYCKKFASRELDDLHNWAHFALENGVNYAFTRHPERYERVWNIRDFGADSLARMPRPFVPAEGVQLKYMSSADDRTHVVYLRQFTYYRVKEHAGRIKREPVEVRVTVDLPGGDYDVEVWNLDTRQRTERTCGARDEIALGTTADDFALVLRAR